jgi:hypothetical protein
LKTQQEQALALRLNRQISSNTASPKSMTGTIFLVKRGNFLSLFFAVFCVYLKPNKHVTYRSKKQLCQLWILARMSQSHFCFLLLRKVNLQN